MAKTDGHRRAVTRVFVNIPYVRTYAELELAIWVTLRAHELMPVLTKDVGTGHARLMHLLALIEQCRYGLSDFSMTRGNIVLEHGVLLAKLHGIERGQLRVLAVIDDAHRIPVELSDLQGYDFVVHGWDAGVLIEGLTKWIRANCREAREVKSIETLVEVFIALVKRYRERFSYGRLSTFYEVYGTRVRREYLLRMRSHVHRRHRL